MLNNPITKALAKSRKGFAIGTTFTLVSDKDPCVVVIRGGGFVPYASLKGFEVSADDINVDLLAATTPRAIYDHHNWQQLDLSVVQAVAKAAAPVVNTKDIRQGLHYVQYDPVQAVWQATDGYRAVILHGGAQAEGEPVMLHANVFKTIKPILTKSSKCFVGTLQDGADTWTALRLGGIKGFEGSIDVWARVCGTFPSFSPSLEPFNRSKFSLEIENTKALRETLETAYKRFKVLNRKAQPQFMLADGKAFIGSKSTAFAHVTEVPDASSELYFNPDYLLWLLETSAEGSLELKHGGYDSLVGIRTATGGCGLTLLVRSQKNFQRAGNENI